MTPSERESICSGEALQRLIAQHLAEKGGGSHSELLDMVAARYMEVCRQYCPTLTLTEWCVVTEALSSIWLKSNLNNGLTASVWTSICDSDHYDGLGAKWHCNVKALAERIRAYDYATTVALVDAVERWRAAARADKPFEETTIPAVVGTEHVQEP